MPDEKSLFLGVDYDTSKAEKAIDNIQKKLASAQKAVGDSGDKIARIEKDLERAASIINDGTDGIRTGNGLLEIQGKHIASLSEQWAKTKKEEQDAAAKVKQYEAELEVAKKKLADTQFLKGIESEIVKIKNTATAILSDNKDLNVADEKLKALLADYNKAAYATAKQEAKLEKLESIWNAIVRVEDEAKAIGGQVWENVDRLITQYINDITEAEKQLAVLNARENKRKLAIEAYTESVKKQEAAERLKAEEAQKAAEAERLAQEEKARVLQEEEDLRQRVIAEQQRQQEYEEQLAEEQARQEEEHFARQRKIQAEKEAVRQKQEAIINEELSELEIQQQITYAEEEQAKAMEEVHNLVVAEGMEFQSINETLNDIRSAAKDSRANEERLLQLYKEQEAVVESKRSIINSIKDDGDDSNTERIRQLKEELKQAEMYADKLATDYDVARSKTQTLAEEYHRISMNPMKFDTDGLEEAKIEAKQIETTLKNIQGVSEDIKFPQMSLDVDDKKLQSLISKYNTLASQYDRQASKVAKLKAQVEELHRIEAEEQTKTGAVSSSTIAKLNQYSSALSSATSRLESIGAKTAQARGAVNDYNASLSSTSAVASKVGGVVMGMFSKLQSGFERLVTRLKNMIFRFVVMRALYAAFNSLKNIMSAIINQSDTLGQKLNRLKSTALVAFYPVIEKLTRGFEKLVDWLQKVVEWIGAFIHAITGADIKKSIANAEKLFNALNEKENAEAAKKAIELKIKARQKEIKAIEKQMKALKKEYEKEKEAIEDKKNALDDEIEAVNDTITALRKQEQAEKKLAEALKKSIDAQIDALEAKKKARSAELDSERKALDDQLNAIEKEIKALEKQKELREEALKTEERYLASFDTLQTLGGSEDEDPEVKKIEDQIEALREKKDALNEVKDAIPSDSEDPLIQQIEAEIDALKRQKEAIEDIDYSEQIQAQQDLIEKYRDQKDALDKIADQLEKDYTLKVDGLEQAKAGIEEAVQALEDAKTKLEEVKNTPAKFDVDTKALEEKLDVVNTKFGGILSFIGRVKIILSKAKRFVEETFGDAIEYIKTKIDEFKKSESYKNIVENWGKVKDAFDTAKKAFIDLVDAITTEWNKPESDQSGFIGSLKALARVGSGIFDNFADVLADIAVDILIIFASLAEALQGLVEGDYAKFGKALTDFFLNLGNVIIDAIGFLAKTAVELLMLMLPLGEKAEALISWTLKSKIDDLINKWKNYDPWQAAEIPLTPPAFAEGAVLPGGKPFLAILGDQPAGETNIETPEKLLRKIMQDEISKASMGTDVTINFTGSLSQLARILQPQIEVEAKRASAFA